MRDLSFTDSAPHDYSAEHLTEEAAVVSTAEWEEPLKEKEVEVEEASSHRLPGISASRHSVENTYARIQSAVKDIHQVKSQFHSSLIQTQESYSDWKVAPRKSIEIIPNEHIRDNIDKYSNIYVAHVLNQPLNEILDPEDSGSIISVDRDIFIDQIESRGVPEDVAEEFAFRLAEYKSNRLEKITGEEVSDQRREALKSTIEEMIKTPDSSQGSRSTM